MGHDGRRRDARGGVGGADAGRSGWLQIIENQFGSPWTAIEPELRKLQGE
jgi:hypothetical protein